MARHAKERVVGSRRSITRVPSGTRTTRVPQPRQPARVGFCFDLADGAESVADVEVGTAFGDKGQAFRLKVFDPKNGG